MIIPQKAFYRSTATTGLQAIQRAGALHRVFLTANAEDATLKIYDNTSATGNPILVVRTALNSTRDLDCNGLPFNSGLYVVLTGATAELNVYFE
jgi:hypothetical protein